MFSNLLFVIEIVVAEFLLTFKLKHREHFVWRCFAFVAVVVLPTVFIPSIDNAWYNCITYLGLFAWTVIWLKFLYKEPWINVIFCGVAAYTIQHFGYQFTNFIFTIIVWGESPLLGMYHSALPNFTKISAESLLWAAMYFAGFFSAYIVSWYSFIRHVNKNEDLKIKNRAFVGLIAGCLILNVLLNALIVFYNDELSVVGSLVFHVSSSCNCLLLLQWQFGLIYSKRLQSELDFTKTLLNQAREQYAMSKENIELINLKCHDMKHQIREIGANKRLDDETIQDLENAIKVYDSVVKTDNDALDVILTEKSFKCLANDIVLNCIVDGRSLDFMKSADIYSLFGNAIENAIEAVVGIEDRQKRIIGLKIYAVGDFVTVNVKNYHVGTITQNDEGLPMTTKKDKNYHGFGMKSIKMIVEKYQGSLSIQSKDGVFSLNLLFPLNQNK